MIIVNPDTILDGRIFHTYTRGMDTLSVRLPDVDAVNWAAARLGQTLEGRRGDNLFAAEAKASEATADHLYLLHVRLWPL